MGTLPGRPDGGMLFKLSALALPPRSMVGQSALNRSIGVRIPGRQPIPAKSHLSCTSLNLERVGVSMIRTRWGQGW